MKDNVLNTRDVSRDVFSATIGSILNCYVGQPLDTVKVCTHMASLHHSSNPTTADHLLYMFPTYINIYN